MNPQRVPKILTYRTPGDLHNGGPVLFQLSIVATATPLSHQVRLVFIGGARRNVARRTALFSVSTTTNKKRVSWVGVEGNWKQLKGKSQQHWAN